jgi:hypothetical protein
MTAGTFFCSAAWTKPGVNAAAMGAAPDALKQVATWEEHYSPEVCAAGTIRG